MTPKGEYQAFGDGTALFEWLEEPKAMPDEVLLEGVTKCLGGESIIQGRPISWWAEEKKRPWALTLNGWVLADIPYVRGHGRLYRVTLETGESIVVADRHKVLGRKGWVAVSDLSIGESVLSGSHEDAPRCSGIDVGSRDDCRPCRHCGGLPPLLAREAAQSSRTSQGGALAHSPSGSPRGDRASSAARSPTCHESSRPSSGGVALQGECSTATLLPEADTTLGAQSQSAWRSEPRWTCSCQSGQRSGPVVGLLRTTPGLDHDGDGRLLLDPSEDEYLLCGEPSGWSPATLQYAPQLESCASALDTGPRSLGALLQSGGIPSSAWDHYKARFSPVESITFEREDFYYDLLVPGEHNYWCGNMLHRQSGKTRLMAEWIHAVCTTWPDSKGLVLRKTKTSLVDAWQDIWETQVLGPDHPALMTGGRGVHRDRYHHPDLGGEVVLGGMDHPLKLFSTNYDWVYVNEVQELTLEEWESLIRCTFGRQSSVPFRVMIGDCNPDRKDHWANKRASTGKMHRLKGRFWDNPMLYDHSKGDWTEDGKKTIERFGRTMTGHRKDRLFYGKWVSAEGLVWPMYDEKVHLLSGFIERDNGRIYLVCNSWRDSSGRADRRELVAFIGGQDIGGRAPGVAQVWGMDKAGIWYRIEEVYKTGLDHEEWCQIWAELSELYEFNAVVCDHDPAFVKTMNRKVSRFGADGQPMFRPWDKNRGPSGEKAGIAEVAARLRQRSSGKCGMYILRDRLRHQPDPNLVESGKPTCLEDEVLDYVYPTTADDKPTKESPIKVNDHAVDTMRGVMCWVRDHENAIKEAEPNYAPDTYGALIDHEKYLGKRPKRIYKHATWRDGKLRSDDKRIRC